MHAKHYISWNIQWKMFIVCLTSMLDLLVATYCLCWQEKIDKKLWTISRMEHRPNTRPNVATGAVGCSPETRDMAKTKAPRLRGAASRLLQTATDQNESPKVWKEEPWDSNRCIWIYIYIQKNIYVYMYVCIYTWIYIEI